MLSREVCAALMLAFGHFLWQGTAIALIAAVTARRIKSASRRYGVFVAGLLLMSVSAAGTLGWVWPRESQGSGLQISKMATHDAVAGDKTESPILKFEDPTTDARDWRAGERQPPDVEANAYGNRETDRTVRGLTHPGSLELSDSRWQRVAPWLTSAYLAGVGVMLLRLLVGLWGGWRLRRRAVAIDDVALLAALKRQARTLGLTFEPLLAYCEQVAVPTVIGILKPTILLPLAITSGLSPEQIESVLAHELAHLKRHDHLVNLLQRVIESLLFFHPAVWWVSQHVRIEREHCCDDLVITCGAIPLDYATSLLRVAELSRAAQRSRSVPAVSLFATDDKPSHLRQRIARLLGESATPSLRVSPRALLLAIGIPLVALIATIQSGASPQQPEQKIDATANAESLPAEPARLQVKDLWGSKALFNDVVKATVGFPKTSPDVWVRSPNREGIVSLDGLPVGTHWLLAAGNSRERLPFQVTIPTEQSLLEQRLRYSAWMGKKVELAVQPVVEVDEKAGEVIVIEILNRSNELLSFSEEDLVLLCELPSEKVRGREWIRGLSPKWLTADREPFPQTKIEAGQTGRMRLNWREWVTKGLWSSRNHEPIAEPGFPPAEPGNIWVKAGLGNGGSLPVSVTEPKTLLLATVGERTPKPDPVAPQPTAPDPLDAPPGNAAPQKVQTGGRGKTGGLVVRVVGRIVDDESGEPINDVAWQDWRFSPDSKRQMNWEFRLAHPLKDGKFDEMLHSSNNYRRRVMAAGYELASLLDEPPNPLPDPPVIERTIRLKKGRLIAGVLRDHLGQTVANAKVFFIPKGHRAKLTEGFPGWRHQFPGPGPATLRDNSVSEDLTNDKGEFELHAAGAGTLAASTDFVDLWPFDLPAEGQPAELKLPAPATLTIDLSYWYLRNTVMDSEAPDDEKRGKPFSPDIESPEQCWISAERPRTGQPIAENLWYAIDYSRQMLVHLAVAANTKYAKGVSIDENHLSYARENIDGHFRNTAVRSKISILMPPGKYVIGRYRTGDVAEVELKAGEETRLDWTRGEGAAVRGTVKLPANSVIQQQGGPSQKLDWTALLGPRVTIKSADGKVRERATITQDGTFFVATHLEPGRYSVLATADLPPDGLLQRFTPPTHNGPGLEAQQKLVIPEVVRGPAGPPPVRVELTMKSNDKRVVPAGAAEDKAAADAPVPKPEPTLGTLSGRFVYDGPLPIPKTVRHKIGDIPPGEDADLIASLNSPEEASLLVAKDGGIANVVVWAVSQDIPWTPQAPLSPVTIHLKDDRYSPRITTVSVGQPLRVEIQDAGVHNFRLVNLRTPSVNQVLTRETKDHPLRLSFSEPEKLPREYRSDIPPNPRGWLLIHSTPYVAISQPDGSFTLPSLPPGEWEFRAWHERDGKVQRWPKNLFKQTIKPGENKLGNIKLKFDFVAG